MQVQAQTLNSLFRVGFIAKGIVYLLIGGLTLATALGLSVGSGGIEGPLSILEWLEGQAFGQLLVLTLGLGLIAYALWRLYRGLLDPRVKDHEPKSAVKRIAFVFSGLANGALGVIALRVAFTTASADGGGGQSTVASLLDESWGVLLFVVAGAIIIATGLYQAYKGYKADFVTSIHWRQLSNQAVKRIGRYGHYARAVVFVLIGYFVILAGTQGSSSQLKGTEGVLEYLAQNSYGAWLLGLTSAGLLLYGVFAVLKGYDGRIAA